MDIDTVYKEVEEILGVSLNGLNYCLMVLRVGSGFRLELAQ